MKTRHFLAWAIAGTLALGALAPLTMAQEEAYGVAAGKDEEAEAFSDWSSGDDFDALAQESDYYEDTASVGEEAGDDYYEEIPAGEDYQEEAPAQEYPEEEIPEEEIPAPQIPQDEETIPGDEASWEDISDSGEDSGIPAEDDPFTGDTGIEEPVGEGEMDSLPEEELSPDPVVTESEPPVEITSEEEIQTETETSTEETTEEKPDPSLPVQVIKLNEGGSSETEE